MTGPAKSRYKLAQVFTPYNKEHSIRLIVIKKKSKFITAYLAIHYYLGLRKAFQCFFIAWPPTFSVDQKWIITPCELQSATISKNVCSNDFDKDNLTRHTVWNKVLIYYCLYFMINNIGPNTDPCGTQVFFSLLPILINSSFVTCFLHWGTLWIVWELIPKSNEF